MLGAIFEAIAGATVGAVQATTVVAATAAKGVDDAVIMGGGGNTILGAATGAIAGMTERAVAGAQAMNTGVSGSSLAPAGSVEVSLPSLPNVDWAGIGRGIMGLGGTAPQATDGPAVAPPTVFVKQTDFCYSPADEPQHGLNGMGAGFSASVGGVGGLG